MPIALTLLSTKIALLFGLTKQHDNKSILMASESDCIYEPQTVIGLFKENKSLLVFYE